MKITGLILAVLSAVAGVWAAREWYLASRVDFVPHTYVDGKLIELPSSDTAEWLKSLRLTLKEPGQLNKRAALWTAASVALSGLAAAVCFGVQI
jgi:hypothetical protein